MKKLRPPFYGGRIRSAHSHAVSITREEVVLEHEVEGRAVPDSPFGPDAAAVAVHDSPSNRQADAGALKLALAVETLERAEKSM
jgi:hypothetical protein